MEKHVVVLVLGDIGRSPRMQYHSVSIANQPNTRVSLVGYKGEKCIASVMKHRNIELVQFSPMRFKSVSKLLFLVYAPVKVIFQILQLFWILLFCVASPDAFLVQNPPSIPTLFVVWIVARLRTAKFIIDWHNLGFTVLGLSLGENHVFVKMSEWYERFFATKADDHFCVTKAMKKWLKRNFAVDATVLYDKPPTFFKPTSIPQQHSLFHRLRDDFKHCNQFVQWKKVPKKVAKRASIPETLMTTLATRKKSIVPVSRPDKPALIVSSTSWTEDEDFGILLDALDQLANKTAHLPAAVFPNLVVVVTGKGPQKQMYLEKIAKLNFARIRILTLWLEAADYPVLLGSADLGVCLHTSTSGIDLPMKVLDMFGCQVPVCAVDFNCLDELVHHNKNGMIFKSTHQLSEQLFELLHGYPNNPKLQTLRADLASMEQWSSNWNRYAAPVLRRALRQ